MACYYNRIYKSDINIEEIKINTLMITQKGLFLQSH